MLSIATLLKRAAWPHSLTCCWRRFFGLHRPRPRNMSATLLAIDGIDYWMFRGGRSGTKNVRQVARLRRGPGADPADPRGCAEQRREHRRECQRVRVVVETLSSDVVRVHLDAGVDLEREDREMASRYRRGSAGAAAGMARVWVANAVVELELEQTIMIRGNGSTRRGCSSRGGSHQCEPCHRVLGGSALTGNARQIVASRSA